MKQMTRAPKDDPAGSDHDGLDNNVDELTVLITAQEAYPALEQAVLDARHDISGCFRVFDLTTRLRSPAARQIGDTWFDLLLDALNRGVAIRLVVSDFDPVAAMELHRLAWRTQRQIAALRDVAPPDAQLSFRIALHDARCGLCARLAFYPMVRKKMREIVAIWSGMTVAQRLRLCMEVPRLHRQGRVDVDDQLWFPQQLAQLHPATHHQKLAVFDDEKVYIGGLDLNDRRYDTHDHARAPDQTWHDVQLIARGPVVAAAKAHLETFLDVVARKARPLPPVAGFVRTLSRRRQTAPFRLSPQNVVDEIERVHLQAIGQARHLIYLETQFLRHLPIARALARRARQVPDLRLIVVLPAAPEDVAFSDKPGLDSRFGEHQQLRAISCLRKAFGADRLVFASPVQPRKSTSDDRDALDDAPLIYVHSKVSIFDDVAAVVSSANLNGRSMRWDTEAGLHLTRKDHVAELRQRVMGVWLPQDAGPEFMDITTGFDHWKRLVGTNSALPPQHRRGFLVEYDSAAARAIATAVPGLPPEIV
ncbi:phospholipase D family protein [Yoonia vestfoldensis]|uniref:Phospholipase D n=1 Tax=Yoonia vestfoldensis TaxID=245188 RepID=A0A1Y0EFD4_9RHOB|nr:phospholipase D-like domain-containing protein [Yoonia vestfoldensis]ARU02324.1 cardiolipin synthetase [Yoonia vestfoldensis]